MHPQKGFKELKKNPVLENQISLPRMPIQPIKKVKVLPTDKERTFKGS